MAEGEKAMAEAKSTFDNPLAEPESAPQIAAEPQLAARSVAPAASAAGRRACLSSVAGERCRRAGSRPPESVARLQPKRSRPRPRPPS